MLAESNVYAVPLIENNPCWRRRKFWHLTGHPVYLCAKTQKERRSTFGLKINDGRPVFQLNRALQFDPWSIGASCVSSIIISILFHSAESRTWETRRWTFAGELGRTFSVSVAIQCHSDLCDWSNGKRALSIMQTIGLRFMSLLWFLPTVMRISVVSGMSSERTLLLLLR